MKQWEYEQLQSELTKKGFLQQRAFFIISINGKEVQKSE